ncbi:MAG: hypothetical protein ABSC92_07775 [Rhizomicrobium sp.]
MTNMRHLMTAACMSFVASAGASGFAHAATIALACKPTAMEAASFAQMGYPDNAKQVLSVKIDTVKHTAGDWETYPGQDNPPTQPDKYYKAKVTKALATWTLPIDKDTGIGGAKRSLDLDSYVLTTIDPSGSSFYWDCAAP